MSLLPVRENEYFEMRFHSIGGQGAYTIGKMLAQLAFSNSDIKASIFATYGSEKKGAPVSVFVRMLEGEKITKFSAVKNPDVVVVFHEQLLKTINVLDGIKENGMLIVNTDLSAQELVDKYDLNVEQISVVNATKYAMDANTKANTVMFGAILKELNIFNKSLGEKQIKSNFSGRYEDLIKSNIEAFDLGYSNLKTEKIIPSKNKLNVKKQDLGYKNQYEGGIIKGNNAQLVDRSISREGYVPKFTKEECINCTKCDLTCPDDCFIWQEEEGRRGRIQMNLQGIDYKHCKGCLRCVEACPTNALTKEIETRDFVSKNTIK